MYAYVTRAKDTQYQLNLAWFMA